MDPDDDPFDDDAFMYMPDPVAEKVKEESTKRMREWKPPKLEEHASPESRSVAVIQRLCRTMDLLNNRTRLRDWDFATLDDHMTWWVLGNLPTSGAKTKENLRKNVLFHCMTFPSDGMWMTFHSLMAQGDRVIVEGTADAIEKDGKGFSLDLVFIFKVKGEHVIELKEYQDTKKVYDRFHAGLGL